MIRTERRKRKRNRGNGRTAGDKEPGRIWEGGEKGGEGGPEPPSDGKSSKLNFKGQSLGINQAAVQGNDHHHPIMDRLGDPGSQTYRQTDRHIKECKIGFKIENYTPSTLILYSKIRKSRE